MTSPGSRSRLAVAVILFTLAACSGQGQPDGGSTSTIIDAPQPVRGWYEHVVESTGYEQNFLMGFLDGALEGGNVSAASRGCDELGLAKLPEWRDAIGTAPDPEIDALMQQYLDMLERGLVACVEAGDDADAMRSALYAIIDAKEVLEELQLRVEE